MRPYILCLLVCISSVTYAQIEGTSAFGNYKIGTKSTPAISGISEFKSFNISQTGSANTESRGNDNGNITKKVIIPKNKNIHKKTSGTNEKRVALIFGNSNYQHAAKLKNPVNDANVMAQALTSIGFDVTEVLNANYQEMKQALMSFEDKISDADVVMCYYAGHGIQVEGENYLIPIDAKLDKKEHIKYETIEVKMVSRLMELSASQNRLNMIILDACRNNPFQTWSRGGDSGLVKIDPPNGTLIAYATSPNSVASDGDGENGLYTGELIKQLLKPQRIEDVFIYTRVAVEEKSNFEQTPWEQAKLRGAYYLVKE